MSKAPTDIRSLARAHTEMAVKTLSGIASNKDCPPVARVSAAQALLDRGWGKPKQPIGGEGDNEPIKHKVTVSLE